MKVRHDTCRRVEQMSSVGELKIGPMAAISFTEWIEDLVANVTADEAAKWKALLRQVLDAYVFTDYYEPEIVAEAETALLRIRYDTC